MPKVPLVQVPSLAMSEGYRTPHRHQQAARNLSFPNGFDRSSGQIQRDNKQLPVQQGFEAAVGLDPPENSVAAGTTSLHVYQAGTLSEMLDFQAGTARMPGPIGSEWYGYSRDNGREEDHLGSLQQQHISSISAAMQLFLTDPSSSTARSTSPPHHHHHLHLPPPPPHHFHASGYSTGTLHMLLPSQQPPGFLSMGSNVMLTQPQFTWGTAHQHGGSSATGAEIGGFIEGQGLSLSLSPLRRLEANKAADGDSELRNTASEGGDGRMLFYGAGGGGGEGGGSSSSSSSSNLRGHQAQYSFKSGLGLGSSPDVHGRCYPPQHPHQQAMDQMGGHHQYPVNSGYGSPLGAVNVLRNSKYAKPALALLEEFCSVGRGQLRKGKSGKTNPDGGGCESGAASSSTAKDAPPLSAGDRMEHQRRKVKLLSMLDEVDRRYNHYCEQMQMVVNSFDLVMGFRAALPYTSLAQKAMSRHFRSLKDAIQAQLKRSCELLGEKDVSGTAGITKGETPRLKLLEHSLRQQTAFHQMGMLDQEAWRPQRGLPERSVSVLRAWLFEHFLHPYPNDADKHLLARQTGLSRNQVSNWFINARVRLWKPMVEEMYQQEAAKGIQGQLGEQPEPDDDDHRDRDHQNDSHDHEHRQQQLPFTQTPTSTSSADLPPPTANGPPPSSAPANPVVAAAPPKTAPENDPSLLAMNITRYYRISETQLPHQTYYHQHLVGPPPPDHHPLRGHPEANSNNSIFAGAAEFSTDNAHRRQYIHFGTSSVNTAAVVDSGVTGPAAAGLITTQPGTNSAAGDVSLTLGLRHAPDKSNFSLRDFGR